MFEDLYKTFSEAKPWEKVLIVAITLVVLGFAVYVLIRSRQAAAQQNSTTLNPASMTPGNPSDFFNGAPLTSSTGISTVPGPGGSSVPILPAGLQPLFDSSGNLIGYQPNQPNSPAPAPAPSTPPATSVLNSGSSPTGLLGAMSMIFQNNGKWYAEEPGTTPTLLSSLLPTGSSVYGGGNGRWWYQQAGNNTQYLLTSGTGGAVNNAGALQVKLPTGAIKL